MRSDTKIKNSLCVVVGLAMLVVACTSTEQTVELDTCRIVERTFERTEDGGFSVPGPVLMSRLNSANGRSEITTMLQLLSASVPSAVQPSVEAVRQSFVDTDHGGDGFFELAEKNAELLLARLADSELFAHYMAVDAYVYEECRLALFANHDE